MSDDQDIPQPAPRRKVRGSRLPKALTLKHQFDPDRREHVGMNGRALSDLPLADLRELVAIQLSEGMDGVVNRYGLTRGEWLTLASDPSWQMTMVHAAQALRTSAVTRFLMVLPKIAAALEAKIADPQVSVQSLLDISDQVTSLLVKIGGIEQKLAVSLTPQPNGQFIGEGGHALAPVQALDGEELRKLQQLDRELSALDLAGVSLPEVLEHERTRKAS